MIGRASIGNPWVFREIKHFVKTGQALAGPTLMERLEACKTHFTKSLEWKGPVVGLVEMRRHYANYFKGIPHFKEFRMRLVSSMDVLEIEEIFNELELLFNSPTFEAVTEI
jgi:tRNA-dihydrouridine synthase